MKHSDTFELNEVVLNKHSLIKFVDNNFMPFSATRQALAEQHHPLDMYNFNKTLNADPGVFTLMGLPVNQLYAYIKNNKEVALYVLMDVSEAELDNFAYTLGAPENLTEEDFIKRDYDVVMWRKNDLELEMLHNYNINDRMDRRIFIIHSMPYLNLINYTPL